MTDDQKRLGLKENKQGILKCQGRVQGHYPIYLPDTHPYTVKLVEDVNHCTLHGGVGLTMACIREPYWVLRLGRLAKRVIKQCYGCRRFQVKAAARPPPGTFHKTERKEAAPFKLSESTSLDLLSTVSLRRMMGRHT